MKVTKTNRTIIQYDFLDETTQSQLNMVFEILELCPQHDFIKLPLSEFTSGLGEKLYVLYVTTLYRLVVSVNNDSCIIEDIISHKRLESCPMYINSVKHINKSNTRIVLTPIIKGWDSELRMGKKLAPVHYKLQS